MPGQLQFKQIYPPMGSKAHSIGVQTKPSLVQVSAQGQRSGGKKRVRGGGNVRLMKKKAR